MILAIDPGTTRSGWVLWDEDARAIRGSGTDDNDTVLAILARTPQTTRLAIEKIEGMGMTVGIETFETVHWSGRFLQAWWRPSEVMRITRHAVKLNLCRSRRANDTAIRRALIGMLGDVGTPSCPGPTYGIAGHEWSALAVAITAAGTLPIELQAARAAPPVPVSHNQRDEDPFA